MSIFQENENHDYIVLKRLASYKREDLFNSQIVSQHIVKLMLIDFSDLREMNQQ